MALRLLTCLLAALAVCNAFEDLQGPTPWRRPVRPEHRRGLNPLSRFIRKSTHDSLELDILVTPGLDPCIMNNSKVVLTAGAGFESQEIGHLSETMLFGLRGFDDFRQNVVGHHVGTRLIFKIMEGSTNVNLPGKKPCQTNVVMTNVILDIASKLNLKGQRVSLTNSKLVRPINPRIMLQPSDTIFSNFLKPIAQSFIKSAEACMRRNFVPIFEAGVNHALSTKNISDVIENLQSQAVIVHEHFSRAVDVAAPKLVKNLTELNLPNIKIHLAKDDYNFTDGTIMKLSKPKLYFVNLGKQKDTYNMQVIITNLDILYRLDVQPVLRTFTNIQYYLQVTESKAEKLKVVKGKIFRFDLQPHPMDLPFPLIKEFDEKLKSVNLLQKHFQTVFSNAL